MLVQLNDEDIDRVNGGFDCEWNPDFPDPRLIIPIEDLFEHTSGLLGIFGTPGGSL